MLYREWFPQIIYNHHQTGPAGTVMFAPPFRDPFNYNFDPLIVDRARPGRRGDAHALRRRRASRASTMRARRELLDVVERRPAHDGLLPQHDRPAHRDDRQPDADARSRSCRDRQLPSGDLPFPIAPQKWHFRQSIDYSSHGEPRRARLRVSGTARHFLFNIYGWGGTRSSGAAATRWTMYPRRIAEVNAADRRGDEASTPATGARWRRPRRRRCRRSTTTMLHESRDRATRAATSSRRSRRDFPTATKFVNTLIKTRLDRASRDGAVHGRRQDYPAGSLRRQDGAGVPPARARHVRAAGSPERLPVSRAARRFRPTTTPAGRSPTRWA